MMHLCERLLQYIYLMRLHKPIGSLLLLWPTLWALWLAAHGHPNIKILGIFVAGVFLTRSAGCIMNDYADRHVDGHVQRTNQRPLATGKVSTKVALFLAAVLGSLAFVLVLMCNTLTIFLAIIGAGLAIIYPLLKRITYFPQFGLGIAFSWGVPMAYAAETGTIPPIAWLLFLAGVIWSVIYDTMYAMVDREDDLKVGIKSTAILFSTKDKLIIGQLQALFVYMLLVVGYLYHLNSFYFVSLVGVIALFIYQQYLIKNRGTRQCMQAFLNNNWVGFSVFAGIMASYLQ